MGPGPGDDAAELIPLASGQIYTELTLVSSTGKNLDMDAVKSLPSPLLEINGRFATATCEIRLWKEESKVCVRAHVGEGGEPRRNYKIDTHLVVRQSTGFPRGTARHLRKHKTSKRRIPEPSPAPAP